MIFNGKSTLLRSVTEHDKQPPKTMAVIIGKMVKHQILREPYFLDTPNCNWGDSIPSFG